MIRPFALALATASLVLQSLPAAAQAHQTPAIACRVLLPETDIPGAPEHSILILEVTVAPGHDGHRHKHDAVEYLHVISGTGSLSIAGMPEARLAAGAVVVIPNGTPHQARNASKTVALVFTATLIESDHDHTVTAYLDDPDSQSGCPRARPKK